MESLENTSEAEKFLIRAGLHDYVGEFKKQKFEKMSDLKLFLSLDNNSWVVDKLNLPVCVLLQLQEALKHHSSEKTGDAEQCSSGINDKVQSNNCMDTDTNECKASNEASPKELKKSEILKLQKTNVEAQSANEELKTFTTYLAGKVKATKWHGGGALRLSSGTTHEEAQANNLLVNVILDDKAIKYGKCVVRGHGVVTLDRKRAKAFIGNKLSHTRKPSAYKGKDNKKSKTTCEGEKEQPTRRLPLEPEIAVPDVQEEQAKSRFQHEEIADIEEEQQIRKRPHLKEIADEEQPNKKRVAQEKDASDCNGEENEEEQEQCQFLRQRNERIERNKQFLREIGLITKSEATIVALFYLKTKTLADVQMKNLREALKYAKIVFSRQMKKKQLVELLGEALYKSKKVIRKDEKGVFSFANLKLTVKA